MAPARSPVAAPYRYDQPVGVSRIFSGWARAFRAPDAAVDAMTASASASAAAERGIERMVGLLGSGGCGRGAGARGTVGQEA